MTSEETPTPRNGRVRRPLPPGQRRRPAIYPIRECQLGGYLFGQPKDDPESESPAPESEADSPDEGGSPSSDAR